LSSSDVGGSILSPVVWRRSDDVSIGRSDGDIDTTTWFVKDLLPWGRKNEYLHCKAIEAEGPKYVGKEQDLEHVLDWI
jgi:hypothetical protein